jgi:hypothetical protein
MYILFVWFCVIWTAVSLPALIIILLYNYLSSPGEFKKEIEEED